LITKGETPSCEGSMEPLLAAWESIFKKLVFIECAQLAESAVTFHQGFVSQEELDDLKQDALTQLWEFIEETISCSEDFKANAKRAIQRRLQQSIRASQKQHEVVRQLKTSNIESVQSPQSPSQYLEKLELTQLLDEALQGLDTNRAKTLAKLNGLGNEKRAKVNQLAADQHVSRQTVRNWRNEAYRQLRKNEALQSLVS
jgi:RNA polymerase sigma factor (sigma-70 family)